MKLNLFWILLKIASMNRPQKLISIQSISISQKDFMVFPASRFYQSNNDKEKLNSDFFHSFVWRLSQQKRKSWHKISISFLLSSEKIGSNKRWEKTLRLESHLWIIRIIWKEKVVSFLDFYESFVIFQFLIAVLNDLVFVDF